MADSMKRFSEEANMQYTYPSVEELVNDRNAILEMIEHHEKEQKPRLKELQEYFEAENTKILVEKRRREEHLADNRAAHGFGEYVSGFMQSFIVGIPLKTTYPVETIDEQIRDINRTNDADEHNSELVLDQSIYGRAYELLYRSVDDETRFTVVSVLETFVIYDNTVEKNPIAAVRYFDDKFKDNQRNIYLYTDSNIYHYIVGDDGTLNEQEGKPHAFGGVPIIEYSNNRFRRGDFEKVLSLIDLYDSAQSDTGNYMQDFNDAMLKIVGNLDIDAEEAKAMKEANLLFLQTEMDSEGRSGQVDANYIYKKYDVAGTEAFKDRVKNDIHMFTYTPNMDDSEFAGTQSGEALKYKLFGLEQKRSTKERLFKKSLRNRYRLINNIMTLASEGSFDVNEITITFTPNLPKSIREEIQSFVALGGDLSDETKLSLLSFVDNPKEELEKMAAESPVLKAGNDMYNFPDSQDGADDDFGDEETTETAEVEKALNGAQITSVLKVIENIKAGLINADQGIAILIDGLKISEEAARKIIKK